MADADNILNFKEMISNVVPQRFEGASVVYFGSNETPARVVATTSEYIFSSSIEVDRGRFITDEDEKSFREICVLGFNAKKALFAFEDPIGKVVRIGDDNMTVVGVMADKYIGRGKVEGFELKNLNEDVYIPFSTARKKFERYFPGMTNSSMMFVGHSSVESSDEVKFNIPEIDQLTVTVKDLKYIPAVVKLIERILKRRHSGVDDYDIVVPESLLRQAQKNSTDF